MRMDVDDKFFIPPSVPLYTVSFVVADSLAGGFFRS